VTPELAEALDLLDWLDKGEIAIMRAAVECGMRMAARRRAVGRPGLLAPWSPVQREIAKVLWSTSDECLRDAFNR
jgi:hypothetical protein